MKRVLSFLLVLFMLTFGKMALAWGENAAEQYETAMGLLTENKYAEAGKTFAGLGGYGDAPRYAMYCSAIVAGESGLYSVAVENLQSLNGFLDSNLLATYYAGLSWEAGEDYEHAKEVLSGISLYRDVSTRIAGYPALIKARDYRRADANEQAGRLEAALSGFKALGSYSDSVERAKAVQVKIDELAAAAEEQKRAEAYAAADKAEQDNRLEEALSGFKALGDYKDSAERAAAVQAKIWARDYAAAEALEKSGNLADAYDGYITLGAYGDSADRAVAIHDPAIYQKGLNAAQKGDFKSAHAFFESLGEYEDSERKAYLFSVVEFTDRQKRVGEGLMAFRYHGVWGVANWKENIIKPAYWDEIQNYQGNGLAIVQSGEKYGCINTVGETVIAAQYEELGVFGHNGLAKAKKGDEYGYIDVKGTEIISIEYVDISSFRDSLCIAARKQTERKTTGSGWNKSTWNYNYYTFDLVNTEGKLLAQGFRTLGGAGNSDWDGPYNNYRLNEPAFRNGILTAQTREGKWCLLDRTGARLGQEWDELTVFSEGLMAVREGSKWGFIDEKGNTVIAPAYSDTRAFSEGLCAIKKDGKWGYIDLAGNMVIAPVYVEALDFRRGQADVYAEGEGWNIINKEGNRLYFVGEAHAEAQRLLEAGRYEEAVEKFAESGDELMAKDVKYRWATELLTEGNYAKARDLFESLGEYADSSKRIPESWYKEGESLLATADYDGAVSAFVQAGEYSNAKSMILESWYQAGENSLASCDYDEAAAAFKKAGDYKDAKNKSLESWYQKGEKLLGSDKFDEAAVAFEKAGEYSDANRKILESLYRKGENLLLSGNYDGAALAFENAGDFEDAKTRTLESWYRKGESLSAIGNYDEATTAFKNAGEYKDAADKTKEMGYQHANLLVQKGDYKKAYAFYKEIRGYKDVDEILKDTVSFKEVYLDEFKKVGNVVTFGHYEQDNVSENGKEEIEWIVLDVKDNKALLLSKYGLDVQQYNTKRVNMTWEKSSVRKWLNGDFLSEAFTSDEQKAVQTTRVDNSKTQGNKAWKTSGGNNTKDKLFLLSYVEVRTYFGTTNARKCQATPYAIGKKASKDITESCYWWLRSPGNSAKLAACVGATGPFFDYYVDRRYTAVRPALWIDLDADIF